MLRHILLIDFQEDIKDEQLMLIKQSFLNIHRKIQGIHSVEWGNFSSPETLNEGFKYCVLITFVNETARDNYLIHSEHKNYRLYSHLILSASSFLIILSLKINCKYYTQMLIRHHC